MLIYPQNIYIRGEGRWGFIIYNKSFSFFQLCLFFNVCEHFSYTQTCKPDICLVSIQVRCRLWIFWNCTFRCLWIQPNTCPLQELQVLLTTESSLQPSSLIFDRNFVQKRNIFASLIRWQSCINYVRYLLVSLQSVNSLGTIQCLFLFILVPQAEAHTDK